MKAQGSPPPNTSEAAGPVPAKRRKKAPLSEERQQGTIYFAPLSKKEGKGRLLVQKIAAVQNPAAINHRSSPFPSPRCLLHTTCQPTDTTQAAQSGAAARMYRGGKEFGQESRIKAPCSGLPFHPSFSQSCDK